MLFFSRLLNYRYALALLALVAVGCGKSSPTPNPTPPPTPPPTTPTAAGQVSVWLTTPDKAALFYHQPTRLSFTTAAASGTVITVDTTQTYQTMDGFGYAFTGGSAYVLNQMAASNRAALMKELFATDSTWLGISYLRVSIGASDLNAQVYTYDDGPPDPTLANFSLAPDQEYIIPMLKEALAVNPNIKILGSPWTAPSWMKTNNSPIGGSLLPQYYDAYAQYFVKYIQGMAAAGITIDAVTLQNEPLYGGNNPSLEMNASEQANFIKNSVGPAFKAAGLSTKIICYDHNADRPDYPISVLSDAAANPYVDGSAFHLYGGNIDALTTVHNAFPNKNVYFTEYWTQTLNGSSSTFANNLTDHVNRLEIGAPRNWSKVVVEWNLAADAQQNPHTPGGCTECLGAITVDGNTVTRNPAYYTVGHSSKFVRPGSVRVATNTPDNLPNVAYKTPAGKRVLVVLNTSNSTQAFTIQYKGKTLGTSLFAGAVATYVW